MAGGLGQPAGGELLNDRTGQLGCLSVKTAGSIGIKYLVVNLTYLSRLYISLSILSVSPTEAVPLVMKRRRGFVDFNNNGTARVVKT